MIESTTNFEDLPEADDDDFTHCVEGRHHVFEPHVSVCRCGVLERGFPSVANLTWVANVWPIKQAHGLTVDILADQLHLEMTGQKRGTPPDCATCESRAQRIIERLV